MKRREAIRTLTILPVATGLTNSFYFDDGADDFNGLFTEEDAQFADGPLRIGEHIYESIGVEPFINCRGTFSIIGGSIERQEVREAMDSASRHFVQYDELAEGIGRRLASITGVEWGMVSSGCSAALKLVTVACVTGGNPEKLQRIPDLTGFDKNEVIIPRQSFSAYDFAIQNVGVTIIRVETVEEFHNALSEKTALIKLSGASLLDGPLGLEEIAKMAASWKVPILADAAAEVLTIPNVHIEKGATMVAYSGGKALCGPQCAGLLLGNKAIIKSAWQASSPHHGTGRDNKVGREEMIGMLAAVEAWVKRDHAKDWQIWLTWLEKISQKLLTIEGITTAVSEPSGLGNKSPKLTISWDTAKLNITGQEVSDTLITTRPRITLGANPNHEDFRSSITVIAFQMQPGEYKIVANRLYEILSAKRTPKEPLTKKTPIGNISGRWDVNINFYSGESQHVWFLEQDGNSLHGSHKADFSIREMSGLVESDQIRLVSPSPRPSPTFIFWGTISGNSISGKVNMGEYLDATFTAKRHSYSDSTPPPEIPEGRLMSS